MTTKTKGMPAATRPHSTNEPDLIAESDIRAAIDAFRVGRIQKSSVTQADAEFFEPLLNKWLKLIRPDPDAHEGSRTWRGRQRDEFLVLVATGMHESMGIRDALILSVVSDLSAHQLLTAGTQPSKASTAKMVSTALSSVFHDAARAPNRQICARCLDVLIEIHARLPRQYCVQPLTVMAYLLWWLGRDDEASGAALRALSIDGECTLAGIVLSATDYGISPAWKESIRKNL